MAASRVAARDDIADGGMRGVELEGRKLLLLRRGDEVRALQGNCPHAGAPLAEGVLDGDRVICPWHKAAFCTRAGKLLEPPAVDDLAIYEVEIRDGAVWVTLPATAPAAFPPPGRDDRVFVLVGGGAAGTAAARELRAAGFGGRVLLVEQEDALPYDRTLLSKYDLSGQPGAEKSPLHDGRFYRDNRIERRIGRVVALDPAARQISFADGVTLGYDTALLATGGRPLPAPFPGAAEAGVLLLRNRADLARIVAAAAVAKRAAVIGAGFIAMEVAAALRERGLEVTVIARDTAPFETQLGAMVGNVLRRLHEQQGVEFRFGSAAVHGAAGAGCRLRGVDRRGRRRAAVVPGGAGQHPHGPWRRRATGHPAARAMKPRGRLLVFGLGCLVLAPAVARLAWRMPAFGAHPLPYGDAVNALAPAARHVSNAISAVNFDIRGFDTLGEEFMLLCAATGVVVLLRGNRGEQTAARPGEVPGRRLLPRSDAAVLITRLTATLIVLFGAYVALHAMTTPGGGFQGGVIVATAGLLLFLGETYGGWRHVMKTRAFDVAEGGGALLYALCGLAGMALGRPFLQNFLPYGVFRDVFSGGLMLVENFGVACAVAGGFALLFIEFLEETRAIEPRDGP